MLIQWKLSLVIGLYLHAVTETKLVVDTSRGETLRINVNTYNMLILYRCRAYMLIITLLCRAYKLVVEAY